MGFLAPKRHRMKHLDFDLLLVRDQGVGREASFCTGKG